MNKQIAIITTMSNFSAAQLTSLSTNRPQMGLSDAQRIALQAQGLATVDDFEHFDEETLDAAFKNLKFYQAGTPAVPAVLDNNNNVLQPAIPAVAPITAVPLGAIQIYRIHTARLAYDFLTTVGRGVTPQLMNFTQYLKDFRIEYDSIVKLSKQDEPDIPKSSKDLQIMNWQSAFENYCNSIFRVRRIPLSYVIHDNDGPPANDDLLAGCLYGKSGSLLDDLIARASHQHPLFKTDNQKVYKILAECTLGTQYTLTVTTYSKRKDGRSAYKALVNSHLGDDKWDKKVEATVNQIMNLKWNGRVYPLEKYCNKHRAAHAFLDEAKDHVKVHEFNDGSKVKYLIDNIEISNADLKAAIGMIRANNNGLKTNFEGAIRLLLPVNPFKPRGGKYNGKRNYAEVGSTRAGGDNDQVSYGTGKTGVELCYYTNAQYRKLTDEQKNELRLWRQTPEGKAAMKKSKDRKVRFKLNKKDRKAMAQAAATMLSLSSQQSPTGTENETTQEKTESEEKNAMKANALKLQGILKRLNGSS